MYLRIKNNRCPFPEILDKSIYDNIRIDYMVVQIIHCNRDSDSGHFVNVYECQVMIQEAFGKIQMGFFIENNFDNVPLP